MEYKNNVDVDYDEFEHTYFIQPNIISDFYDYYVIHALPQIYYKDGYVNYGIGFSFIRSDWIFTEKIIVDCDGKQNRFEVKYLFNDLRDVLFNGDIFEACVILHTEDNRSTGSVQNLTTMIENIAAAESVKIRFDGSDGNYDVELSDEEINAIVDTWELFEILNSDPDLISYFK